MVTKDLCIFEFVVKLGLFKNKLKYDNLVKHISETIPERLSFDLKDWVAVQSDR